MLAIHDTPKMLFFHFNGSAFQNVYKYLHLHNIKICTALGNLIENKLYP